MIQRRSPTHQNGPISWMRVKCINQIPDGKQREPENCTSQVEIVTRAPFEPPVHPRKQLKRFRDVRKGDDHKARPRRRAGEEQGRSFVLER